MASTPRATGAHPSLALSSAERATVAAELARLSARVANLAARLDHLHTALAAPADPSSRLASIPPPGSQAAPSLATASGARPWQ